LGIAHEGRCPNLHPERFKFSSSEVSLTDEVILKFYIWCKRVHHFRGIVNWNGYNEPSLAWDRISGLICKMREIDSNQPIQIVTNSQTFQFPGVDIVTRSYYGGPTLPLDNRIASIRGEGKPYEQSYRQGRCIRGMGWEIVIDHFGNWLLCCNDFRCEESIGSIVNMDWNVLFEKWQKKTQTIEWNDKEEYERLPRICRSCMDVNPIRGMWMSAWV
jgi:hypothetical protein